MAVSDEPKLVHIRRLDQDSEFHDPPREILAEIRADDLEEGTENSWGFLGSARVLVPFLVDLPEITRGDFTELAIDVHAPAVPGKSGPDL